MPQNYIREEEKKVKITSNSCFWSSISWKIEPISFKYGSWDKNDIIGWHLLSQTPPLFGRIRNSPQEQEPTQWALTDPQRSYCFCNLSSKYFAVFPLIKNYVSRIKFTYKLENYLYLVSVYICSTSACMEWAIFLTRFLCLTRRYAVSWLFWIIHFSYS